MSAAGEGEFAVTYLVTGAANTIPWGDTHSLQANSEVHEWLDIVVGAASKRRRTPRPRASGLMLFQDLSHHYSDRDIVPNGGELAVLAPKHCHDDGRRPWRRLWLTGTLHR